MISSSIVSVALTTGWRDGCGSSLCSSPRTVGLRGMSADWLPLARRAPLAPGLGRPRRRNIAGLSLLGLRLAPIDLGEQFFGRRHFAVRAERFARHLLRLLRLVLELQQHVDRLGDEVGRRLFLLLRLAADESEACDFALQLRDDVLRLLL